MRTIFIALSVVLFTLILTNQLLSDPEIQDDAEKLDLLERAGKYTEIYKWMGEYLKEDPDNVEYHYRYIHAYYNRTYSEKTDSDHVSLNYSPIQSTDSASLDLANFGSGWIAIFYNSDNAEEYFNKVKNKKIKFLNYGKGLYYYRKHNDALAEQYFNKETSLHGYYRETVEPLSFIYLKHRKFIALDRLLSDPSTMDMIPREVKIKYHFIQGNITNYLSVWLAPIRGLSWISFVSVLGIAMVWVWYIVKMDVFEKESRRVILAILIGSGILALIGILLSNIFMDFFSLSIMTLSFGSLILNIFWMGSLIALIKITPLLLLLKYTKSVNESFDYILVASLSAIGYTLVEFLFDSRMDELRMMGGGMLLASFGNMFTSTLIAYGIILGRYRWQKRAFWIILGYAILSILLQGIYTQWKDFFRSDYVGMMVSAGFFIFAANGWSYMLNNTLNQSAFFNYQMRFNHLKIVSHLHYAMVGIFVLEYIAVSITYGPSIGNYMAQGVILPFIAISYLLSTESMIKLRKGNWLKFDWFSNEFNPEYTNDPDEIIGSEVELFKFSSHDYTSIHLPNKGKIIRRLHQDDQDFWYLVQLENAQGIYGFHDKYVVIKPKEYHSTISRKRIVMGIYLIKNKADVDQPIHVTNMDFMHRIYVHEAKSKAILHGNLA